MIDIGCGAGVTATTIAAAFPNTRCLGYDPLDHRHRHGPPTSYR